MLKYEEGTTLKSMGRYKKNNKAEFSTLGHGYLPGLKV